MAFTISGTSPRLLVMADSAINETSAPGARARLPILLPTLPAVSLTHFRCLSFIALFSGVSGAGGVSGGTLIFSGSGLVMLVSGMLLSASVGGTSIPIVLILQWVIILSNGYQCNLKQYKERV